mmetsp:Transcript_15492/g.32691  ORF Transcript_15492/g.32691 Transcript_15492/m.32691 type:complete len:240 (-) Transcript_15492:217-936(-)
MAEMLILGIKLLPSKELRPRRLPLEGHSSGDCRTAVLAVCKDAAPAQDSRLGNLGPRLVLLLILRQGYGSGVDNTTNEHLRGTPQEVLRQNVGARLREINAPPVRGAILDRNIRAFPPGQEATPENGREVALGSAMIAESQSLRPISMHHIKEALHDVTVHRCWAYHTKASRLNFVAVLPDEAPTNLVEVRPYFGLSIDFLAFLVRSFCLPGTVSQGSSPGQEFIVAWHRCSQHLTWYS